MKDILKFQTIKVQVKPRVEASLLRFYRDKNNPGVPVFMLHGFAQNGSSFYTAEGEGLACFLAREGFDVYVPDLRGRAENWPLVGKSSDFGVHELITEDIPALLAAVADKRGNEPQVWIGHGFGGVLLSSYYARFAEQISPVKKFVQFAVRRRALSARQCWQRGAYWPWLARRLSSFCGYLPANAWRLGHSDEPSRLLVDYLRWSTKDSWSDPVDGFDYAAAIQQLVHPPGFYFASSYDDGFASAQEVRAFMAEQGDHDARLMLLGRKGGSRRNYGHSGMLNHRDCKDDHFRELLSWLRDEK